MILTIIMIYLIKKQGKFQKAGKIILILMGLHLVAFGMQKVFVPVARSDGSVRKYILDSIPMGVSYDNAVSVINDKNWKIKVSDTDFIYLYLGEACVPAPELYFIPLWNGVSAKLSFDENSQLTEVTINREIDAT